MRSMMCLTAGLLSGVVAIAGGVPDDRGRELAATCATCHGTSGTAQPPMPSLAALPPDLLAERMREFREGRRPATVMHQIARGFDDAQVAAIARHLATPAARR